MFYRCLLLFFFFTFSSSAFAIEKQLATNWCWAASVQDVVAQAGYYESQPQVATRLTGWPQNRPAYIPEVVALVQSYGLKAWQAGYPGTPQQLHNTLSTGWKIIAFVKPINGLIGHYIVLEGVDSYGNIVTGDPANGLTMTYTPQQIYYAWHWLDSVVVGK